MVLFRACVCPKSKHTLSMDMKSVGMVQQFLGHLISDSKHNLFKKFNLFYFIIITMLFFSFFFFSVNFSKIPCKKKKKKKYQSNGSAICFFFIKSLWNWTFPSHVASSSLLVFSFCQYPLLLLF